MPRRPLRCVVELNITAVSAPGVWLSSREHIYLSICLLGQYRNTKLVRPVFPLSFHERFIFEKVYYTALDPSEVVEFLEDDLVVFELLQMDCYGGAVRLASYSCSARDFLFPYPSLSPIYCSPGRDLLLGRCVHFPGIAPKLEFTTTTTINESISPELDVLDDALRRSRSRQRSRSLTRSSPRTYITVDSDEEQKNYHRPTVSSVFRSRSRSLSPAFRKSIFDRPSSASYDVRPPFVVRRLGTDLIGRVPGYETEKSKKMKKKKVKRSSSLPRSSLSNYSAHISPYCLFNHVPDRYCLVCKAYKRVMGKPYWGHGPNFHPTGILSYKPKILRDPLKDPLPVYGTRYVSDDDAEVAALTSSLNDYYIRPRSRSPSPLLYKSSYRSRYVDSPLTAAERVELRVQEALDRRNRSRSIDKLYRSVSPVTGRLSPYRYYGDTLYDLEVDTNLARRLRSRRLSTEVIVNADGDVVVQI